MPEAQVAGEFSLVRDFAIVMAVAGAALVLFRRLNQPPILGYLIAGLIVGPFTLPLAGLRAPVPNAESIRLLADLGLVLLLFAIGLEFGWQRIRQMGFSVVLIGAIEVAAMIAIGYRTGRLLGWDATDAIFLGAALSMSSSAIIVKVLRDSGTLFRPHGRLIVGILVVEDFAAVLLLSILSQVAATGAADLGSVGALVGKLALFLVTALALGGLFAPRLMSFVARFQSRETLLIVSLALCFGLALIAGQLGISAAAGAFLMGTVLGDTEHSEQLIDTMSPVRDVFAALFFVSIGMLIDLSLIRDFIIPALVVSAVFILGMIIVSTVGTFITGHDGKTSLAVGMGLPQIGEFSLAIIKVGTDRAAVGAFLYPVVAVTTAFTTLLYPFIFRSTDATAAFLERRSPRLLRHYLGHLSDWLVSMRTVFSLRGDVGRQVRRSGRTILVNLGVIVVLLAVGTFVLNFTPQLTELIEIRVNLLGAELTARPELTASLIGLVVSIAVVSLCVPSGFFIWRALHSMTDGLADAILRRRTAARGVWRKANLRIALRDSMLIVIVLLVAVVSLPFVLRLVLLGIVASPIPIALLAALLALTWRTAFKIHRNLLATFNQTFLGDRDAEPDTYPGE